MQENQTIQWFPGHMAKTRRLVESNLRLVDIVVELTDARIPYSSRNPELDRIVGKKPRIVLLNKSDTADEEVTRKWLEYYQSRGIPALATDCRSGKGMKAFLPKVKEVLRDLLERRQQRGNAGQPIRMMIVGIPNVGKSSFINRMANSRRTKVEDRPGVTRGKQWVTLDNGLELLDMPGVLWPKFEDQTVGRNLAFTGAVKDDVLDVEWLAMCFLEWLNQEYPQQLLQRYRLEPEQVENATPAQLLELVGRKRGMLVSGGEVDTERAAVAVLDEFRSGRLGRISLERPPQ